ncbi:MAG TPA: cytochrome c oxidase assembly protein [Candidatus Cybelea sp.]|jgi:cytochrome c oxidase assembly factor CtaG|nr:cytochrome c oxidase assembly protein [Candidatus Cybelea sp.]
MPRALLLAIAALTAAAAVAPPFDTLADRSFAWHMLQHLALLFLVTLLVLLARPFELFAAIAGKHATARFVRVSRPLHVLALPPVALAFFVATLWATHYCGLYEESLENAWVHAGEHLLYLAAGTIFWLPVLASPPLRPASFPVRLLYLAVALPQGALLAMALVSARSPLYPHYAAVIGSTTAALADQRNAAAVMWIAGGLVVLGAFLLTLGQWARRESEGVPSGSQTRFTTP